MATVEFANYPVFNLPIPKTCTNVPADVLNPASCWSDKTQFDNTVKKLAGLFQENFKNYASQATPEVIGAGPKL